MHVMTYLHTTQNTHTHTITHTWHNYLWPQYTPIRSAGKSIAQWRCSTPGRSKKEASEWRQDVLSCFKMCQNVSRCVKMCQGGSHMYGGLATWPVHCHSSDLMKSSDSMQSLWEVSRVFWGSVSMCIYIYIYWIILNYIDLSIYSYFFFIYIYIQRKIVTRKVGSTPPRPPLLRG